MNFEWTNVDEMEHQNKHLRAEVERLTKERAENEARFAAIGHKGGACTCCARVMDARRERDEARALLNLAWDKIPEGYTVLRGEILTALGQPGCTRCGYDCTENPCPTYT